jgi:uncharacterized RDD family membrane protein YckC
VAPTEAGGSDGQPRIESALPVPSIRRRVVVMLYESIVLAAILLIAALPFVVIAGDASAGWHRALLQTYLLSVLAGYFCHFWLKTGQTLAMQTWHVKLVAVTGVLSWRRALGRFALVAVLFLPVAMQLVLFTKYRSAYPWLPWLLLPALASILYARFDADKQFWHDKIVGTRLVQVPKGGKGGHVAQS